ncbi:putative pentatricopeptide [Medicago truncatula]|uniref:Putative pentatricopeptide n=1 Tax=Medicago truncatula TaxID=3880 RepID=A0A396ING7_MEDTR|nr:putative pentatricopeptide [Medicago truncatula]
MKTFNLMIKSYGKAGMYDKIKTVTDFMERRFFAPTIVTYEIDTSGNRIETSGGENSKIPNQPLDQPQMGLNS